MESPKIVSAGVEIGVKMLVGLKYSLAGAAHADAAARRKRTDFSMIRIFRLLRVAGN
jgi:hypothetical protein